MWPRQDVRGQVKYVGGSSHLDSIPATFRYADLAFRLTEKVNGAVSIKYLPPGEEVDEDNLIGIWDDADVQVQPSLAAWIYSLPCLTFRLSCPLHVCLLSSISACLG